MSANRSWIYCLNNAIVSLMNYKKPARLQQYFWDVQWNTFDPKSYPNFTIERLLEYGDPKAVDWLEKNFSKKHITTALKRSRTLSKKSANYWSFLYKIKPSTIQCLKTPYQKKQSSAWKS